MWNPHGSVSNVPEWYFDECAKQTIYPDSDNSLMVIGYGKVRSGDWIVKTGTKLTVLTDDEFNTTYSHFPAFEEFEECGWVWCDPDDGGCFVFPYEDHPDRAKCVYEKVS